MRGVKVYQPPGQPAPVTAFLDNLEPKFRDKLVWQIFHLSRTSRVELKEPHYKHFCLERYACFYELREREKITVRIIFTYWEGDVLLINAIIKRRSRDITQALEQSLRILAEIRDHPEYAVEFKIKEEST